MMGAVIVLLSYISMVYKTFGKIHLSFLVPEELGAQAWEWEEPEGSTTMSLPRSTVLGTQYKTSQRNSLAEAGLCLGQGARSDAKERVHLWGSPRGRVSDDKVTHIWDFPASSAPGHCSHQLLRHPEGGGWGFCASLPHRVVF